MALAVRGGAREPELVHEALFALEMMPRAGEHRRQHIRYDGWVIPASQRSRKVIQVVSQLPVLLVHDRDAKIIGRRPHDQWRGRDRARPLR